MRLISEASVVPIEAKAALEQYKADLFYSSFEMARSQQLALQGLLDDLPSAAARSSEEGSHA